MDELFFIIKLVCFYVGAAAIILFCFGIIYWIIQGIRALIRTIISIRREAKRKKEAGIFNPKGDYYPYTFLAYVAYMNYPPVECPDYKLDSTEFYLKLQSEFDRMYGIFLVMTDFRKVIEHIRFFRKNPPAPPIASAQRFYPEVTILKS